MKNMAEKIRLDRCLAEAGIGTRSEVKKLIRSGRVFVNGEPALRCEQKVDPDRDEVSADDTPVRRSVPSVLMLNKPAGAISATKDPREKTVLDLIHEPWAQTLHPVGRLDKDTEGLLLLTRDGSLSHALLSPKKHVVKTYFVVISGMPDPAIQNGFREGLEIGGKKKTLPAKIVFLASPGRPVPSSGEESSSEAAIPSVMESLAPEDLRRCREGECCAFVSISEGKYHQIKRMFGVFGREVRFLKRVSMGQLTLDPALAPGEYRPLTEEEIHLLRDSVSADLEGSRR